MVLWEHGEGVLDLSLSNYKTLLFLSFHSTYTQGIIQIKKLNIIQDLTSQTASNFLINWDFISISDFRMSLLCFPPTGNYLTPLLVLFFLHIAETFA